MKRNLRTITYFMTICLVLGLSHLNAIQVYAQGENVALINGTLLNSQTHAPIQTTLIFLDDTGKEIKSQSEANGQYQAVLTSGKRYKVAFKNYYVLSDQSEFSIDAQKVYKELKKDFELHAINVGTQLLSTDAFSPNSENLNANTIAQISQIQSFFLQNRNVKFKISIGTEDSKFETPKTKSKPKSKAAVKLVTTSPKDELMQKRISALINILTSKKFPENTYTILQADNLCIKPVVAPKKDKKKGKTAPSKTESGIKIITLKIEIDSIMKLD